MASYQAYVVSDGGWARRDVGFEEFTHASTRTFTDLAGQQPKFPDHWASGFWAAPDRQLYVPTDRTNTWGRAIIGCSLDIPGSGKFTVTQRMTQAQADDLNRPVAAAGAGQKAQARIPPSRLAAARDVPRTIYCPNGHAFSTAVSGPVGFRRGEMRLVAACAAFAPLPLRR
jgi:hypothetical protein